MLNSENFIQFLSTLTYEEMSDVLLCNPLPDNIAAYMDSSGVSHLNDAEMSDDDGTTEAEYALEAGGFTCSPERFCQMIVEVGGQSNPGIREAMEESEYGYLLP